MNILQVVPYFPPAYAFGGPVKVVYSISKELVKRGHNVTVYTTDAMSPYDRLKVPSVMNIDGIEVHYMRNLSLASIRLSNLFIPPRVAFVSKSELKQFDVIHLHEFTTFQNVAIVCRAIKVGVPYVLQTHGSLHISGFRRRKLLFNSLFGKTILRNASKLLALSEIEAEQFKCVGVPSEKIAIFPNGIDLSNYSDLPTKGYFKKKFNIQAKKKIVLYLGRVHKTKGIDLLIKSYVYLTQTLGFTDCFLVIAGPDDGYMHEAKCLLASLGACDSALFTGYLDEKDKVGAMIDASLFVTPSFFGFPMTFLEACITGTPIVTTTLGDELEWINGNVGYVTPPNPSDLAKAAYSILSNQIQYKYFSERCRNITATFSIEKVTDKLEQIYEAVLPR
jgi:glycosyltransferase involved in cell wall biosynthesis